MLTASTNPTAMVRGEECPRVAIAFGIDSNAKKTPERNMRGMERTRAVRRAVFSDWESAPKSSPV